MVVVGVVIMLGRFHAVHHTKKGGEGWIVGLEEDLVGLVLTATVLSVEKISHSNLIFNGRGIESSRLQLRFMGGLDALLAILHLLQPWGKGGMKR